MFRQPTTDLWYNNSQISLFEYVETAAANGTAGIIPVWHNDEPASPLGCVTAYQWCIPGVGCMALGSQGDQMVEVTSKKLTDSTWNRMKWIGNVMAAPGTVDYPLGVLSGQALTARLTLSYGFQSSIADNQWQQDVRYWMELILALFQKCPVTSALGDFPKDDPGALRGPDTEEAEAVCANTVGTHYIHPTAFAAPLGRS